MSQTPAQRRYLPSHAILRSFEAAARHESFTLAAQELNLTQSAISRQVKELEAVVGVVLFRRAGRRVILSAAGARLARELALDLENIRQTVSRAVAAGDQGISLRIAVLPTFASRWLIPRLPEFCDLNPDITLNLSTRLKPFDLSKERFDIAIHFGVEGWPDTKMVRILEEEMIPVCSPAFRARHDLGEPSRLRDAPLLHLETRPTAWGEWFHLAAPNNNRAIPGRQFDQFSMLIAGARASLGAALLPKYLIEDELETGALLRLGHQGLTTRNGYFVVTAAGINQPPVSAFCDWIKAAARIS